MEYRLYFLDTRGHIKDAIPFSAENDRLAVSIAEEMAEDKAFELWNLGRCVMQKTSQTSPGDDRAN